MIVKSLTVKNFRNHSYLTYDFFDKINVFVGDNGVGKTNIVEAIYYLSLARSFRIQDDKELIKKGALQAYIDAKIFGKNLHRIEILFSLNGRKILIDKKPISKLSELSSLVNVIVFQPSDVLIFKGSPKERRSFLNISISKQSNQYLQLISDYEKLLKQRNNLLKQDSFDGDLLDVVTNMMIDISKQIIDFRTKYISSINSIIEKIINALSSEDDNIKQAKIQYLPFVELNENFVNNAKECFKKSLDTDMKHKSTSVGIHREDFFVTINGKNIATYGSQGENRILAIALKLAPYFLIKDNDKKPIVILDDVFSELDKKHQNKLIKFLNNFQQVFITATNLQIKSAHTYFLKKKGE